MVDVMTTAAPLLIATTDDAVTDAALRWCAAVGAVPEQAADVVAVRRSWRAAAAVLVGADLVGDVARAGLPRRDHVLVLAREPATCWPAAMAVGAVAVCAPHDELRAVDLLTAALDGSAEACVVSVVGGSGGAGASVLTAALGVAAARRRLRPLVVDLDPLGGGIDLVLGAEDAPGVRWDDFDATHGRLDAASLTDVLPTRRGVAQVAWARGSQRRVPDAWGEVVSAAARSFDLVAIDLPRALGTGPAAEAVGRSVLTLVVVPEEISAVAAARHVLAEVAPQAPAVGVVSVWRPGGIGTAAVEEALGRPALARVRPDRRLRPAVDQGQGPGRSRSLRRAAATVLDAVGLERS